MKHSTLKSKLSLSIALLGLLAFAASNLSAAPSIKRPRKNPRTYREIAGWEKFKTDVGPAWRISTGSRSVRVAVVDSLLTPHPDLNANTPVRLNQTQVEQTLENLESGLSVQSSTLREINNRPPLELDRGGSAHGNWVSGVIGAVGNNARGIVGLNWKVSLIGLQGCRKLCGTWEKSVWLAGERGIPIVNLSMGRSSDLTSEDEQFWNASDTNLFKDYPDTLFVISAGNEGKNIDADPDATLQVPCGLKAENIICVGSSNFGDRVSNFSNYGRTSVDVFAPGENIITTGSFVKHGSSGVEVVSGTSFSAPFVSGMAALALSVNPKLTPRQIKAAILNTADRKPQFWGKSVSGGRVNVARFLKRINWQFFQGRFGSRTDFSAWGD